MQLGFLTDGSVEDVAFAAREGFDCVELALFGDTPLFDDCRAFKQALSEHNVALPAVSLFGKNYFESDGKAMECLRRVIKLTAALESPLVVFGTGVPPEGSEEQRVTAAMEKMRPAVTEAQVLGLQVALYNCPWENVIDRPSAWDIALPQLPNVGVKFDPSHPPQSGRDWKPELLAAGPHLLHAHAKDVLQVGGRFIADPNPGLGDIRWEEFFGILYHVGYDGAVCIEPHSAVYAGARRYEFLKFSGNYLRRFIAR